jgi:hypothetical protein
MVEVLTGEREICLLPIVFKTENGTLLFIGWIRLAVERVFVTAVLYQSIATASYLTGTLEAVFM